MNPQVGVAELLRYLTGESSEDEARHVQAWSRLHAANAGLLESLRYGGDEDAAHLNVDVAHGMERLQSRLNETLIPREGVLHRVLQASEGVGPHARQQGGFKPQPLRRMVWSVAAAVVLGIVTLLIGWNAGIHHISQRAMTYATGNGERATITLPDGGTVALNVASRLNVPLDYMAGDRTVRLVGEGLFTMPHHAGTPLTVLAGTTTARVLGTSFVVRRYAMDTATMVAVRDGKVAVGATIVTANQLVEVGRSGMPHLRSTDAAPFTFATGVLTIDSLPLPAAVVELDRWFDVDIRLGDPTLATSILKGTYAAGSLRDLTEILELTFNVHVVRNGRVLTLFPGR